MEEIINIKKLGITFILIAILIVIIGITITSKSDYEKEMDDVHSKQRHSIEESKNYDEMLGRNNDALEDESRIQRIDDENKHDKEHRETILFISVGFACVFLIAGLIVVNIKSPTTPKN